MVYNEKVVAVIGPLASKTVEAVTKKAQAMGVPMITLTQKEGVTKTGDMIFRNFLTPSREVDTILEAAMGNMGLRRFAIIYPNNAYGNFYMNLFWDRLDAMGGEITAVESYDPEDTDFADQIKRMVGLYHPRPESVKLMLEELKAAEEMERDEDMEESGERSKDEEEPEPIIDFDAVFIPDNFERVAMIAPQLVYYDISGVTLLGTSLWQSSKLIETAKDYVQGAVFSSGFFNESNDPDVKAFVEEYKNTYESEPGILAATGYDTIRFLKEVMGKDMVLTRRNLKNELINHGGFTGVTGRIYFDADGDIAKAPFLLTVIGRRMALFQR
jgi:branched-chain amino acid transport system substrate-binding protein